MRHYLGPSFKSNTLVEIEDPIAPSPQCRSAGENATILGVINVAILHPIDPAGHVPSGIDAFIRGILKFAPPDIHYTLFGATSDPVARPPGKLAKVVLGERAIEYWPLVTMGAKAERGLVPLTIRYMQSLLAARKQGLLAHCNVLDFHRIEPSFLFSADPRPKNVLLHQDMSVIRDANSDILWRHAPWLYEWLERRAFSRMRKIFAVRQSAVQRYRQRYPEFAHRFAFIPTWVDSTVFVPSPSDSRRESTRAALRRQIGMPPDAPLLVFVGRLDQQKDPLLLIESLKLSVETVPTLHLAVVGDGVLRSRVEEAVGAHQLAAQVHFLGVRPPLEIAEILRAADQYVLCSAYEGMPIALLEALATGLPVVCTDVGEVRLVVHDSINGQISAAREPRSFADAILKGLSRADAMRGAACEQAVSKYRPEPVLENIYANHRSQGA
jgi:glycosyltransferase involved in cell wall biosynthesis